MTTHGAETSREGKAGKRVSDREFDVALGLKLRARRLQLGMSQADLAAQLGVSFQQVQKYENGQNRVSGARLKRAADALSISLSDLCEDAGQSSDEQSDQLSAGESAAILRAFQGLKSKQKRDLALRLVAGLSELEPEARPKAG